MFSQNTKAQNKKTKSDRKPGNDILDEIEAEDVLNNIGNEAVNQLITDSSVPSNEAKNLGMLENKKITPDDNIINDDLINNIAPIIKNDIKNNGDEEGDEIETLDQLFKKDFGSEEEDEKDLVVENPRYERSKKKSAKKKRKSGNSSAAKASVTGTKDIDLTQIDKSMEPAAGWDFVAEKFPARKKQGFLSKLGSWAAYYSGKTVGKIGGIIATILKSMVGLVMPGSGTLKGIFNGMRGSGRFQKRKDSDIIPGWDGAKFQKESVQNDDIDLDFRRVPELWAWPTAAKAAEGDEKKRDSKPVAPVITAYVSQASDKYTVNKEGETGHSGIGIEFSRYSALSGRWQRYNLRFGYYMSGGTPFMERMAVTSYNNAVVPGRLMDEKGKAYEISRSFTMQPKQVGDVLRAAESYADRGGYNVFTRNCTTFAKEMIVDVAKIKGASDIFSKDEVRLPMKVDAQIFGAGATAPLNKADMENAFNKIGQKEDMSYQHFGDKLLTKDDYIRYRKSLKLFSKRTTEAYSPNSAGENMKRSEGGASGSIGMFTGMEVNNKAYKNLPINMVLQELIPQFTDLRDTLANITPENKLTEAGMTGELRNLMDDLDGQKLLFKLYKLIPNPDEKKLKKNAKQSDLVKARTIMTDTIKKLNTLLFRFYRNDKRVQEKVLFIINVLNHGLNSIDEAYTRTEESDLIEEDKDLNGLIDDFGKKSYTFTHNRKKIQMSATEYEAWLQVYKTPKKALDQYLRFNELKNKSQTKMTTPGEEKELENLKRVNDLINEFIKSHRYMLNKEKYNQQDVDYAFLLEKKERKGGVASDMLEKKEANKSNIMLDEEDRNEIWMSKMKNPNASASGTYQMLIMKGVFGGMKERYTKKSENADGFQDMLNWIVNDALDCINRHKKEMTTIIRGLKHTTDDPDEKKLKNRFNDLLIKWIFQLFHKDKDKNQYIMIAKTLTEKNGLVMEEVERIISNVMAEENKPDE